MKRARATVLMGLSCVVVTASGHAFGSTTLLDKGVFQFGVGGQTTNVQGPSGSVNANSHVCVLSGVYGVFDYDPYGEATVSYRPDYTWYMEVGQYNAADTLCTPWSNFVIPPSSGGAAEWIDGIYYLKIWGNQSTGYGTADGTWASMISSVRGQLDGFDEYVDVNQSSSPSQPSNLVLGTTAANFWHSTYLEGNVITVSVTPLANPSQLVKLYGWSPANVLTKGDVLSPGIYEYDVSTTSGYSAYWMAQTDQAICYFSTISGQFRGGGEAVKIYKNNTQWFVQALATGDQYTRASARCMAYNQF